MKNKAGFASGAESTSFSLRQRRQARCNKEPEFKCQKKSNFSAMKA
jgi:hypothetical protein